MRSRQQKLFEIQRPRQKPRKLMHVIDAGTGYDEMDYFRFGCRRCGYESEWEIHRWAEAKRGIPCPQCNQTKEQR